MEAGSSCWMGRICGQKYPHLVYLKMGWIWWSPQRQETDPHANTMTWNSLCCILHFLPCSQFIAFCTWVVFLLLHLSHFIWIAQEPLSRRKIGKRFSSFCPPFHLPFECHKTGRFLLCRARFKSTLCNDHCFLWDWALLGGLYPAPGEVRDVSTSVYPSAFFPQRNIPSLLYFDTVSFFVGFFWFFCFVTLFVFHF